MTLALLLQLCATAASFDVKACDLPSSYATAFLAHADTDGRADVFILQGHSLTIHTTMKPDTPITFQFPEKTVLFDITDIDGNEQNELVGFVERGALAWPLPNPNETPPRQLFTFEQALWEEGNSPRPAVLVIEKDGKRSLLVPTETALEVRALDGTLQTSMPAGTNATSSVNNEKQRPIGIAYHAIHSKDSGSWSALSSFSAAYDPDIPADIKHLFTKEIEEPLINRNPTNDGNFVIYRVNTSGDTIKEALVHSYFVIPIRNETTVRIRERKKGSNDDELPEQAYASEAATERRYPGIHIWSDTPSDFNRDGYADLTLLRVPNPGNSIDKIARAMMDGTTPFTMSVHLFLPDQNRFEANAAASLTFRVSFSGAFTGRALRDSFMEDLDGDGRTDVAFVMPGNRYGVWLYNDKGFNEEPDFICPYSGDIESVRFINGVNKDGGFAILLRTEKTLYVLTAPKKK